MVDHSNIFRCGCLTERRVQCRELGTDNPDVTIPYVSFELESEIPIGFGQTNVEKTNVALIGVEPVTWWKGMVPAPKPGDIVRLNYCTAYVSGGVLCCRITMANQVEVVSQGSCEAQGAGNKQYQELINAKDFFSEMFAAQKGE